VSDLFEFASFASTAREEIPPGKVSWNGSPFSWMRMHGPRTKNKLGRGIVREFLIKRGQEWVEAEEPGHFEIPGYGTVVVHLGLQGKEGMLEFANLRQPGLGADRLWLIGVEPQRVRLWSVRPHDVVDLPVYVNDKPGYHHCSVDPEEIPTWMHQLEAWA